MTPSIKAKWSFLSHIKLGAQFYLVEVSLENYISQTTYSQFKGILDERKFTRDQVKIEEEYYHKAVEIENNNILNSKTYEFYYSSQRKSFNSNFSSKSNKLNQNDKTIDPTLDEAFNSKNITQLNNNKEDSNINCNSVTDLQIEKSTEDLEKSNQVVSNSNHKAKLEFLLDGGSYDQIQKEEEKKIKEKEKSKVKEFVFNEEEFPELNSELLDGNSKKKGLGGGGRKKKKKFVELNI
jgi:hypothetical protein